MKLMELAKKLRDKCAAITSEKQRLSQELQVNVLQTQMKTIDQAFKSINDYCRWRHVVGSADDKLGAVGGKPVL